MTPKTKKALKVFSLAMINVALIASLRGLPTMAEYGFSVVFFLAIGVIAFLIPSSLISAELATGWSERGGVYAWVRTAFGERWGFLATWLQWVQNIVFYPTALAATAAVVAYIFAPELASNKLFTLAVILAVYWGATLLNLRGMKASGKFTTFGTITGILIPGAVLISFDFALSFLWFLGYSQLSFSLSLAIFSKKWKRRRISMLLQASSNKNPKNQRKLKAKSKLINFICD